MTEYQSHWDKVRDKAPWLPVTAPLLFAGYSLQQIDRLVGGTPFYAYDRQLLQQRLQQLHSQLDDTVHVHYAVKANPMPALVDWMAQRVQGLDVASQQELIVALNSGMAAQHISLAGPGKHDNELAAAIAAGCVIQLESRQQLQQALRLGAALQQRPQLALRINPDFQLKNAGMKMTGQASPFGLDYDDAQQLLQQWPEQADFVGLHFFAGSQNLSSDAINACHQQSLQCALTLLQGTSLVPQWINIGGGLGIPYFNHEQPLPLSEVTQHLNQLAQQLRQQYAKAHLVLELGRYLVGEAGIYVCQIVDKKVSKGETFLICDGGLHHHLAASGNFGQVIRKNYPVLIGNRLQGDTVETVNIVGPLCTPLDKIADKVTLPQAHIGDYVMVLQSGAYGLSASPSGFLSQPPAKEILLG